VRPLRLEVKGFTAFRDPVELDFTTLDVFAISGPTGSGKSSLLDAMTYALYGRVDRIGDRVSQLISQGQPRMTVMLEFEVGTERYRVTRSTPAKGSTKIQVERADGSGQWKQAGEGSDRVREAERILTAAIGLSYDGYTRSVMLPQGRFAEFLTGDPNKRRDILTQLLGLSLFKRMAERARSIGAEAKLRAQTMMQMVEREFADATPEAMKEARLVAKEAAHRESALGRADEAVIEILSRWERTKRSIDDLRSSAEEAVAAAAASRDDATELADLDRYLRAANDAVRASTDSAAAAREALDRARAAVATAGSTVGTAEGLAAARLHAHAVAGARSDLAARTAELAPLMNVSEGLGEAVTTSERVLSACAEEVISRERELAEAEQTLETARHADLVATFSAGLKVGDPCPVCGEPLAAPPPRANARSLRAANAALVTAQKAAESARRAATAAERSRDAATRDAETNEHELARVRSEVTGIESRMTSDLHGLRSVLGDPLPDDPLRAVDERTALLRALEQAERDAERDDADAARAVLLAEQERDRAADRVERSRDRLLVDHRALLDRAARALGSRSVPVELPAPATGSDPAELARHAAALAAAFEALAEHLGREIEDAASTEARLLSEANAAVDGLVEPEAALEALAKTVDAACRAATAEAAAAHQRLSTLKERLERKKKLASDADALLGRGRVFNQLGQELRADRLIAYLQAEALQLLAAAGSERLAALSDGRYRITCPDDEFLVVDTWNGDEERSVRTLSGGETFLASLALALALAGQVRSLSTTDRARLDSLFLDEGFGTLDPETLRTVTDAIEQLAGDGRLVGVITHVPELAEQFPRVEVVKSPRGSRLRVIPI